MSDTQVRVSVIIATRFRSNYIGGALESLTKQSLKADELVIVDNGPCDKTKAIVDSFKDKLPIKYVIEPIQGVAHARNKGIKSSQGEFILFMDDDCLADKYWIENIMKTFEEHPDAGCVGGDLYPIKTPNPSLTDEFCYEVFSKGEPPVELESVK